MRPHCRCRVRRSELTSPIENDDRRLVANVWRPQSHDQCDTVERLALRFDGVLVRTLADGAAEVLAVRRGVFTRHVVTPDGFSVVVETKPRDWRWALGPVVASIGVGLFGASFAAAALAVGDVVQSSLGIAGIVVTAIGMGSGALVTPQPYYYTRPGEEWQMLSFADD